MLGLFTMLSFRFMFSTLIPIWITLPATWGSFFLGVVSAGLLSNDPEFLCLVSNSSLVNYTCFFSFPIYFFLFYLINRLKKQTLITKLKLHEIQRLFSFYLVHLSYLN
jgi:hypothetical protein